MLAASAIISFTLISSPLTGVGALENSNFSSVTPRIYGGTPATGNLGVAALAINTGGAWDARCSAAVWKPRVLLTAGHCVTLEGGAANVPQIAVSPPGATAIQYSNTGPQTPSSARVTQILKPSTYVNASQSVEPNDIAVLVLDSDLGPGSYNRLATSAEMTRWAKSLYPGTILGYGLVGPDQLLDIPMQAQIPIDTYEPRTALGSLFSITQSSSVGICSGDSGGPTFATNTQGERLLLGVNSGAAGGCVTGFKADYQMIGFSAIDYLSLINSALTIAGYPTIPSAPQSISLKAVNNSIVATWTPPSVSPETVVGYEVVDPNGNVVCQTTELTCSITNLPAGTQSFTVRAKNNQGEGNALPATATATIAPPTQMNPPIVRASKIRFQTLAGTTSAVVTQYRVVDARGKRVCTLRSFDPTAPRLSCPLPTKPGKYRFRVLAVTEMGQTPPSGLSKLKTIS